MKTVLGFSNLPSLTIISSDTPGTTVVESEVTSTETVYDCSLVRPEMTVVVVVGLLTLMV